MWAPGCVLVLTGPRERNHPRFLLIKPATDTVALQLSPVSRGHGSNSTAIPSVIGRWCKALLSSLLSKMSS